MSGPDVRPDLRSGSPVDEAPAAAAMAPLGPWQRARIALKRLSTRSHFWHSALTMVFMPSIWRSGIRMKLLPGHFQAVLPFNRQNRNFDGDVSGAALLGNCEVAAGGYVFYAAEGRYSVVCKKLSFTFRRACRAAVEYRVHLHDGLHALVAAGRPFTIDLDVDVFELGASTRQVGTAAVTFYVRPIGYMRSRERQRAGVAH